MLSGLFRRRRLPHWDVDDGTYFVTTCLAGSVPARGLVRLRRYRDELERRPRPDGCSVDEWEIRKHKLIFARFDDLIDFEPAVRHLANEAAASEVQNCLQHFAGERYDLLAFVVMPSHFHWVFRPRADWVHSCVAEDRESKTMRRRSPRERIMKSIKGYSARRCNELLELAGHFWQDESYDHLVRDEDELMRIIDYIENNPVKAGLVGEREDWRWSSASVRLRIGMRVGQPLVNGSDIPICHSPI